jgi:hypothetical protein
VTYFKVMPQYASTRAATCREANFGPHKYDIATMNTLHQNDNTRITDEAINTNGPKITCRVSCRRWAGQMPTNCDKLQPAGLCQIFTHK